MDRDRVEILLDIADAAFMLNLSRSTVYTELAAGRIRSIKVGRRRFVPTSAVFDYLSLAAPDAAVARSSA